MAKSPTAIVAGHHVKLVPIEDFSGFKHDIELKIKSYVKNVTLLCVIHLVYKEVKLASCIYLFSLILLGHEV